MNLRFWRKSQKQAPRRVLIVTLPLQSNYGGILQAWALQKTLRDRGHAADTTLSAPKREPLKRMIIRTLQWINSRGLRGKARQRQSAHIISPRRQAKIDHHLISFVHMRMSTVDIFRGSPRSRRRQVSQYSAFIVGSDQVWRPRYMDAPTALFGFVPEEKSPNLFSYAASFGIGDTSEFSNELRHETKELAKRLAGISVREASGVNLVRELWGRDDAIHHVDPTLLVRPAAYEDLIRTAPTLSGQPAPGSVLSYVLDPSSEKQALGQLAARHLGLPHVALLRPYPATAQEHQADPDSFQKIPVEAWLGGIHDARALITDSFHGCVFAILFHVPFVAVPNPRRGAERFKSLLGQFGLQHRMITETEDDLQKKVEQMLSDPIDWVSVDSLIAGERVRAWQYLDAHLGSEDRTHA